jgi:hypothetical protein
VALELDLVVSGYVAVGEPGLLDLTFNPAATGTLVWQGKKSTGFGWFEIPTSPTEDLWVYNNNITISGLTSYQDQIVGTIVDTWDIRAKFNEDPGFNTFYSNVDDFVVSG